MKFICDKNLLNEAINSVSLAVSSKSTISSLEGILINCKNDKLTLTGYNLEFGIVKTIDVKTHINGEIILNASLFSNIVSKMPSGDIEISCDEKLLTIIRCNDVEFTILGLSTEDYPEIPNINDDVEINISAENLQQMIHQTLFAVSQSDQNLVYTGTLFDIEDKTLTLISVDGFRMAVKKQEIDLENKNFHFIVPGKTLSEIQKILLKVSPDDDNEEIVKIRISNKHVAFIVSGYLIISRLLEGKFLDYKTAFPKTAKTTVTVCVRDFINSINRASIIINDKAKSPIKCEFKENTIKINCETSLGKITDSFEATIEGDDILIGVNNKYMLDALRYSECDEVLIKMNNFESPITVSPVDSEDFSFLVLPVRLLENANNED